jgi:hypothetical protein
LETFKVLASHVNIINSYFANPTIEHYRTPLQLSATDSIEFRKNWGKNLLCITNVLDSNGRVSIAKTSWDGLVNLFPLLIYVGDMYQRWQEDAFQLFTGIAKQLKLCLPVNVVEKLPLVDDMYSFKEVLKQINFENIKYEGSRDSMLNLRTTFLEIQSFCAEQLAAYIPYI